jgi:hypothetical protein
MKAMIALAFCIDLMGCCRCAPTQRFIPVGGGGFALDTKTGQQCLAMRKQDIPEDQHKDIVFCVDLYNGSK